jgi:hypothetical protein
MKTTVGKLRNITTGILHTNIGDVYKFIEDYTGEQGIMTHQLPSACEALTPILKRKLIKRWFEPVWQKEFLDDEVEVPDMTEEEKQEYWKSYGEHSAKIWDLIKHKTIVIKSDL